MLPRHLTRSQSRTPQRHLRGHRPGRRSRLQITPRLVTRHPQPLGQEPHRTPPARPTHPHLGPTGKLLQKRELHRLHTRSQRIRLPQNLGEFEIGKRIPGPIQQALHCATHLSEGSGRIGDSAAVPKHSLTLSHESRVNPATDKMPARHYICG